MRSRYTAFVRGDVEHLLRTWHPDTRPATLELDPSVRWTGLEVLDRVGGGLFDVEGVVEFRAHHRDGVQHERSRFARDAGRWVYRDGAVGRPGAGQPLRRSPTGTPRPGPPRPRP
jgi:SEC-C motif domain protein